VDSLPLASNGNLVVDSGTRTSASPNGEQILPAMSCENASVPFSFGPTSSEPYGGGGMNQSSRIPEEILSQNSSGTSRALNTPSAVPSGQGGSAPVVSTPSEAPQVQIESPAHTHNESINQNTGATVLEEVVPTKGPMTGGVPIALFGENFPAGPLYVCFGDNWARAVRYAWYHCPF